MMRCQTFNEQLCEWIDGRLTDDAAATMSAHADACPDCGAAARLERRILATAGALPSPPVPDGLAERTHRAVEALALLEQRHAPAAPTPLANPLVIQWVSMAAVLLITITAGLGLGVQLERARTQTADTVTDDGHKVPNSAPGDVRSVGNGGPGSQIAVPVGDRTHAGGAGSGTLARHHEQPGAGSSYAFRYVPEQVREQLARHVNSTQAVYDQAMKLDRKAEAIARPLIKADLTLARLDRTTPRLRVALKRAPKLSSAAAGYLEETERMVASVEHWLRTEKSIDDLRTQLEQIKLARELRNVRRYVEPQRMNLRAMVPRVEAKEMPVMEAYMLVRQHMHEGRLGMAAISARELAKAHPSHPLSRNAVVLLRSIGSGQMFVELEVSGDGSHAFVQRKVLRMPQAPNITVGALHHDSLSIDGRRFTLRRAAPAVQAFHSFWKAAEDRQRTLSGSLLQVTDSETAITPIGGTVRHVRQVTLELSPALWSRALTTRYQVLCAVATTRASSATRPLPKQPARLQLTVAGDAFSRKRFPR